VPSLQACPSRFVLHDPPDEVIDGMRGTHRWAELTALAPTLAYDSAVMGDIERGGTVPVDVATRVPRPGVVLVGGESPRS
jgi:hypothetical protein